MRRSLSFFCVFICFWIRFEWTSHWGVQCWQCNAFCRQCLYNQDARTHIYDPAAADWAFYFSFFHSFSIPDSIFETFEGESIDRTIRIKHVLRFHLRCSFYAFTLCACECVYCILWLLYVPAHSFSVCLHAILLCCIHFAWMLKSGHICIWIGPFCYFRYSSLSSPIFRSKIDQAHLFVAQYFFFCHWKCMDYTLLSQTDKVIRGQT